MARPDDQSRDGTLIRLTELLRTVLPARSLDHLVTELARTFRDITGARAVVVSFVPASGQFHAGVIDKRAQSLEAPYGEDDWSEDRAVQFVRRDADITLTSERHMLAMNMGSQFQGGVILEPQADKTLKLSFADTLVDLGARLISDWLLRAGKIQPLLEDDSTAAPFKSGGIVRVDAADRKSLDFYEELQAARMDAMAEFAAGAGHEINNPVATISGRVQLLLRSETDPERRAALQAIGGQALRIRDMIGDAMLFARPPEPSRSPNNLAVAVREVVEKLSGDESVGCRFELDIDDDIIISADSTQLRVVISSLLQNSIDASSNGSVIRIVAKHDSLNDRPAARLEVHDQGTGLSERDRECLFDPFYSGRQAGRGLGFGLPKCWRIVGLHHGKIACDSSDAGTVFRVLWPCRTNAASSTPAPSEIRRGSKSK